ADADAERDDHAAAVRGVSLVRGRAVAIPSARHGRSGVTERSGCRRRAADCRAARPGAAVAAERRMTFAGQTVVITGGASGIGLAAADRFAMAGAHVAILDRNERQLAAAAARLNGNGVDAGA